MTDAADPADDSTVDADAPMPPDVEQAVVDQTLQDAEGGIEGSLLDAPETPAEPPLRGV